MKLTPITSLLGLLCAQAFAATELTGDSIEGYPIITSLDVTDVPANTISRYWFRAGTQFGSIPLYLPVLVARGSNSSIHSGSKLSLSASIHGDELNGVPVVQRVFANETFQRLVQSGSFNGTVIGLPTMNPNGNQHSQRLFYSGTSNGRYSDLNRLFPGTDPAGGASLANGYIYNIWNGIWGNTSNVDIAVDCHYRFPYVQRLAELSQADIIKIDPGDPGTVETTFIDNGVPAITLEIGTPKLWQEDLISRSEAFIYRLMADLHMTPNATPPVLDLSAVSRWTNFSSIGTTKTGWVRPMVKLLEMVEVNQTVADVVNSWGDVIERLNASVAGQVHQVRTDPIVEQGTEVVNLAYNATI